MRDPGHSLGRDSAKLLRAVSEAIIRPFQTSEWRHYRDARLTALKDAPDAFGSTYESSKSLGDSEWKARLKRASPENDLPLAAFIASDIAGMSWAKIEPPDKTVAHLFQMWVAPRFRGLGLSRQLLDTSVAWARERSVDALVLGVTLGDTPARRLYESAGFLAVGELEPLREGSELQVQTMMLSISNGT